MITIAVYSMFRPKVVWEDKTYKKQLKGKPVIFVGNHTNHFDGAFACAMLERYKPYVLVQKSWYEDNGIGKAIRRCRSMPIDIDGADADWYMNAETLIKQNGTIMIFPEGKIARSGVMEPFKPGAALLSASTGAVIVPCAIYGRYDKVFGKRQRMYVGKPIESHCPDDMRHSKYARMLMSQAEADVRRLYGEFEQRFGKLPVYADDDFTAAKTEKETVTN